MNLTKITDISKYFEVDGDRLLFIGNKLEVYIPNFYEERGLLELGYNAKSLGILQLRINDAYFADIMILAKINIEFVSSAIITEDGYKYTVLYLEKGSAFLTNRNLMKIPMLIYDIFVAFLSLGRIPPFINYDMIQSLFDNDEAHCGINLGVNHCVYEMIFAHIYRDAKDPYTFYRNTPMIEPPTIVPTHQISHGPTSTTARIVGSYIGEGMTAALVDDTERAPSTIENMLRS
jgi:hypothetical protein